ncbi:MAG: hypothetical protein KA116_08255 [Proteobacteria bacterium]|nr:hypothetical protein [Pseudomonadota bacterium]
MLKRKTLIYLMFIFLTSYLNAAKVKICGITLAKIAKFNKGKNVPVYETGGLIDYVPALIKGENVKATSHFLPLWLLKRTSPSKLFEHAATLSKNEIEIIQVRKNKALFIIDKRIFLLEENYGKFHVDEVDSQDPRELKMFFNGLSLIEEGPGVIFGNGIGDLIIPPISLLSRQPKHKGYRFTVNDEAFDNLQSKLASTSINSESDFTLSPKDFMSSDNVQIDRFYGAKERLLSGTMTAGEALIIYMLITSEKKQNEESPKPTEAKQDP